MESQRIQGATEVPHRVPFRHQEGQKENLTIPRGTSRHTTDQTLTLTLHFNSIPARIAQLVEQQTVM